jgi:hypothetical protein
VVTLGLRPKPYLAAVRIVDDRMRCFGGEDEDSAGFIRAVDDLVPAGGPFGEHCDVAGLQLALPVGPSKRRPPGDGNEPLLAADLVVVGPRLLARRELVEAAAEQAGSEALTDYADSVAVAGAVVLAVPRLLPEEVEDVDSSIVRFGPRIEAGACSADGIARSPRQRGPRCVHSRRGWNITRRTLAPGSRPLF